MVSVIQHPHLAYVRDGMAENNNKQSINFLLNTPPPPTPRHGLSQRSSSRMESSQFYHAPTVGYSDPSVPAFTNRKHMPHGSTGTFSSSSSSSSAAAPPSHARDGVKKRHKKMSNLPCAQCGNVFGEAASLRKHMRVVHDKVKDFECDICGHRCAERSNLKKHVQARHQSARSHKCGQCDKVFNFSDGLRRHINNCHLKLRPHVCHICGASFKQRTHLQKHCQSIHNYVLRPLSGTRRGPR